MRDLKDDPWERIACSPNGSRRRRCARFAAAPCWRFRSPRRRSPIFGWNAWPPTASRNCAPPIRRTRQNIGAKRSTAPKRRSENILNIIYSISPKHTDEYFIQRIRAAAKLKPERLCFKDPGGLLTPEVDAPSGARDPARSQRQTGGISHPLQHRPGLDCVASKRSRSGITSINTAIPPLADGSSNPSLFNVAMNAARWAIRPMVDEEPLNRCDEHFIAMVAKQENLPIGRAAGIRRLSSHAPSARRHDFQLSLSAGESRQARPAAGGARRSLPRARRVRLSDHGDALLAVLRRPGRDQRDGRRAL